MRPERFDVHPDVTLPCPACGQALTGLQEVIRRSHPREPHPRIDVHAEPCGCEVTEDAARLQADAILLEHDLAEQATLHETDGEHAHALVSGRDRP